MTEPVWRAEFVSCLETVLNHWKIRNHTPSAERVLDDLLEEVKALSEKDSRKEDTHE